MTMWTDEDKTRLAENLRTRWRSLDNEAILRDYVREFLGYPPQAVERALQDVWRAQQTHRKPTVQEILAHIQADRTVVSDRESVLQKLAELAAAGAVVRSPTTGREYTIHDQGLVVEYKDSDGYCGGALLFGSMETTLLRRIANIARFRTVQDTTRFSEEKIQEFVDEYGK